MPMMHTFGLLCAVPVVLIQRNASAIPTATPSKLQAHYDVRAHGTKRDGLLDSRDGEMGKQLLKRDAIGLTRAALILVTLSAPGICVAHGTRLCS
eukprot:81528-Prymnesium_polylepis.2